MTASDVIQLSGHVLDSGAMGRTFDDILELGGDYVVERFDIGKTHADESAVRLRVTGQDEEHLARLLMRVQAHGANLVDPGEALLRTVERRRRVPRGLLLDDEPRHRGADRRALAAGREPGDGLRSRRRRRASSRRSR